VQVNQVQRVIPGFEIEENVAKVQVAMDKPATMHSRYDRCKFTRDAPQVLRVKGFRTSPMLKGYARYGLKDEGTPLFTPVLVELLPVRHRHSAGHTRCG
jgi:hypothetical protein